LKKRHRDILLFLFLFTTSFFTTTLAGVQWLNMDPFELSNCLYGLLYSFSILSILTAHEFGHFFVAKYYNVNTSYPFFIPIPPFIINPFGTLGAVMRIRSQIPSKKALFDIGISGPIAGFIISILLLAVGFYTLPSKEYLFSIHPEYIGQKELPITGLTFGNSILFWTLSKIFSLSDFVPPMNEIYHYPFLCAGWFGMFVTALNLMPVGQLDGGHILYSIIGKKQGIVAMFFLGTIVAIGLLGLIQNPNNFFQSGTTGWLVWAVILIFIIKLDHPEIHDDSQIDKKRIILGWTVFIVLILIFPPIPFTDIPS
jgi:membrane-associated protease RseP (regulator of RpoE activity)